MNNKLPEGWKIDKFENLVSFTRGSEPGSSSYTDDNSYTRFLRVSDISGTGKEKIYTTAENLKLVNKGDLLITLDGTPGIISDEFEGAISSGIRKIDIVSKNLLQDYLKFYLRSENVQRIIYKYATGATILHASKSIQYINVVLPPIDIQKCIINIMKRAESALNKRKQVISLLDELVKSQFIEMFGDPSSNPKGWEVKLFNDVFDISSSSRILKSEWKTEGTIPFYRVRDMVCLSENGVASNEFFVSEEFYESLSNEKGTPQYGDIMVSATSTIGKCYIVKPGEKFYYKDADVLRFRKKVELSAEYFVHFMKTQFAINQIKRTFGITTVPHFTIVNSKKINLIYPPIELQNQFADFVKQVDKLKFEMEESLKELENNFNSLMKDAFSGNLSL
ncbi:restriction endonuclease subunit S [Clostridium celatum]|uniref:restriction endonuclease subunit S n=1 Tax=Clostridium celatum TaxID=36834 RepID=UPI00290149A1|nr:restriction endonuclease subunit S [Clostridium celatum]MDU2265221.1 restriction endonuclease subunit S [Clostridium celatum]MDU6295947.1 restriction endonuclease subunit S [Clostridium celatum]